jgi:hypothetical protein
VLAAATGYAIATMFAFRGLFAGKVLLWPWSDQLTGYAPRLVASEYLREFGRIPEWNPYLFGGFPFVANTGLGDTFFPTALLRVILPVDVGMAAGFMIFAFLAGLFAFLFLRGLQLSWAASFVGGAAYMFSGMILSMVSPGHDGKLFVSALLPLALLLLFRAALYGDWRNYLWFGAVVGACVLTPHTQSTYYLLMAAGFFWFFIVFLGKDRDAAVPWFRHSLLFAGSLGVAFALASVQLIPFLEYIPFSPRGESHDWATATSWSMAPLELIGTVLPGFSGSAMENYYGPNQFKLHSDYFGAAVVLLALASFRLESHRKYAWFFVFLVLYATLFALGGHTPFYHLPYNLLPGIAKTRAPSIIFFVTSFSVAVLAAFGTEFLLSGARSAVDKVAVSARKSVAEVRTVATAGLLTQLDKRVLIGFAVLLFIAVLAAAGALRGVMESFALSAEQLWGEGSRVPTAQENYPRFVAHLWFSVVMCGAAVLLLLPATSKKLGRDTVAILLALVVFIDLWSMQRSYFRYTDRAETLMPADGVVAALRSDTTLYRVLPLLLPRVPLSYQSNYFMGHRIRTALGYNSFELDAYDKLLGGKGSWGNPLNSNFLLPNLWQLIGVHYVVSPVVLPPADSMPDPLLARFRAALTPVDTALRTYEGGTAALYRVSNPLPFAFLVPTAWRTDAPLDQVLNLLMNPDFDPRGLLLVPRDAPVGVDSVSGLGAPIDNPVRAREERIGKFHFELERPADNDCFLFVAENHYKGWSALVDGEPAPVVKAQVSLMAVPVRAGARTVDLEFSLPSYRLGIWITLLTIAGIVAAVFLGRQRRPAQPAEPKAS